MRLNLLLNRPFDRVKITTFGKFFSAFTLLFGIATINSGNNLLYMVLAYLLILLFASGILSTVNILFLGIEPLGQEDIYKGRNGNIIINISKDNVPGFFLYFCTDTGCTFVPKLKGKMTIKIPYKSQTRGIHKIDRIVVYSLYPFGFARRWREIPVQFEVLVFPGIDRESIKEEFYSKYYAGYHDASKRGFDGEFHGLRRYRKGESLYHIHWKKSFKELNLKEFGTMEAESLVFRLRESPSEEEIDTIATLIHKKIKEGRSVGLIVEKRFFIEPSAGIFQEHVLMKRLALL